MKPQPYHMDTTAAAIQWMLSVEHRFLAFGTEARPASLLNPSATFGQAQEVSAQLRV